MDITWKLGSCKTGQGFGSATTQYMDLFIKFDLATGNGYALRIQRTNRQGDGTEWGLVKYVGWDAFAVPVYPRPGEEDTEDAAPVSGDPKRWSPAWWDTRPRTSAFSTVSTVRIWTEGGKLKVSGATTAEQTVGQIGNGLSHTVSLEWDGYEPNAYGGFGLWQNGSSYFGQAANDATTSLRGLDVEWK